MYAGCKFLNASSHSFKSLAELRFVHQDYFKMYSDDKDRFMSEKRDRRLFFRFILFWRIMRGS